ncbi:peroxisomal biogenesis factor 19 isoform X2 [Corythoichthys intestinalis]|uniref:peroxisomal biogenesis factor 19 isoform X2 n=1 Tax=Corythoichthys intestinalis TaxID=161448 RepID=UPI0025A62750|nr:peroxisomal biogenesis factor 19 isoform X2 [Corythoichthys intestinalis]XP_061795868.1 peroxisomal biogenesis factor 19-like [Nerophis lumbriciformis]
MASAAEDLQVGNDAELDELLDSALADFDKQGEPPEPKAPSSSSSTHGAEKPPPLLEDCKLFETLFQGDMAAEAQQEWEKAMSELAQEEPDLLQHFQKLSEAAGKVGTDTASQQEFTSCLKDTLRGLAKNADNLQSSGLAGDDLVKALEGLGLEEGGEGGSGDDANILPIMQSIMQNLLSKEVLYPSLKEITTKYPEWLEANRSSLSPEDVQRYEQQARIMSEICQRFEKEEDGDKVFEGIMDLMQQLQDLGQPPKELAGDAPPGLNFDLDSLNLPGGLGGGGGAEQCSIM